MTSRYHSTSNNSRYRVPGTRKSYTYDSKSNDTILNDLERSITDFKVTSLFDAEDIRNATKYSYNALIRHTQSCHFEWPWPWFGKIVNATKYCTISVTAELLVFTASHWSFITLATAVQWFTGWIFRGLFAHPYYPKCNPTITSSTWTRLLQRMKNGMES